MIFTQWIIQYQIFWNNILDSHEGKNIFDTFGSIAKSAFSRALIKAITFPRDTSSFVEFIKSEVAAKTEKSEHFIVEFFECFQRTNPMTRDDINIKRNQKIKKITCPRRKSESIWTHMR